MRVYYCKDKLELGLIYLSQSKSLTDFSILNIGNKLQRDLCHIGLGCRDTSIMINGEIVKSDAITPHPGLFGTEAPGLLLLEIGEYF